MKCSCELDLKRKTATCAGCGCSVSDVLENAERMADSASAFIECAKEWYSALESPDDARRCFELAVSHMDGIDAARVFAQDLLTQSGGRDLVVMELDAVQECLCTGRVRHFGSGDDLVKLARLRLDLLDDKDGAREALAAAEETPVNDSERDTFEAYRKWFGDDAAALLALKNMNRGSHPDQPLFVNLAMELPAELQGRDAFIKLCLEKLVAHAFYQSEDVDDIVGFSRFALNDLGDPVLAAGLLNSAKKVFPDLLDRSQELLETIAETRTALGLPLPQDEMLVLLACAGTREVLSGKIIDASSDVGAHIAGFLFGTMDDLSTDIFNEKTTATIRLEFQPEGVRLSVPQLSDKEYHAGVLPYGDLSDAELAALFGLATAAQ